MPHQHSATHTELLEQIQQHLEIYLQQPNPDGSKRSKAELARALYIDRTTLYKWLDGTNRLPAREGVRLLQLLGVYEVESVE